MPGMGTEAPRMPSWGAAPAHLAPEADSSTHHATRTWRIVLQDTALETIAALSPRFGRLKDGVWVPNLSEIARQGGISKQHLGNAVAGRDGAGEAVHAALLGVAATYGLGPDRAWGKLFKLVPCDRESDALRASRRKKRPRVGQPEAALHVRTTAAPATIPTALTEAAATGDARGRARAWARKRGYRPGERGPLRAALVEQYLVQHPEDREALTEQSEPA